MKQFISFRDFLSESEQTSNPFITEAAVSMSNISKACDLIAAIASKKLNAKLVRLKQIPGTNSDQVSFKKSDGTEGSGYMYVSSEGYRLRIGHSTVKSKYLKSQPASSVINAVDFWDKSNKDFFGNPTRSAVATTNKNFVEIANNLLDYLFTGKITKLDESKTFNVKHTINESVDENDPRRISPYFVYAVDVLGMDIPDSVIKPGVGASTIRDKVRALDDFDLEGFGDWYSGYKKGAVKETNSMQSGIKNEERQLSKVKYADPDVVFDDISKLTAVVASGHSNSLIVSGSQGGTGKTFTVQKTMESLLGSPDGPNAKWRFFKGSKTSPMGLYSTLFINRNNMTLVFDDSDAIFQNDDTINMLKSALDTSEPRRISWNSTTTQSVMKLDKDERDELNSKIDTAYESDPSSVGRDDLKLPAEFVFTSRMIIITNIPKHKLNQPILSRSYVVDVNLTQEDMIKRIRTILKTDGKVDESTADEIIDALEKSGGNVTMRAVSTAVALKSAGLSDWMRFVENYVAS